MEYLYGKCVRLAIDKLAKHFHSNIIV